MERIRARDCPIWDGQEDFTPCFRVRLLDTLLPISLVCISLLAIGLQQQLKRRGVAASPSEPAAQTSQPPGTATTLAADSEGAQLTSSAAQQLFQDENTTVLRGLRSSPIDPVPAPRQKHIIHLNLLRATCQTLSGIVLTGLHAASWASGAGDTRQIAWGVAWVYYVLLSCVGFTSSIRVYYHVFALQLTYLVVRGIDLRSLLISHEPAPRWLVILTSWELAITIFMLLLTMLLPQHASAPSHLRALYSLGADTLGRQEADGFDKESSLPPNAPELTASLYSRLWFSFATPHLWKHYWYKTSLADNQVPNVIPEDLTAASVADFRLPSGGTDGKTNQRSLYTRLFLYFWPYFACQMTLSFFGAVLSIAAPLGTEFILYFIKLRWRKDHDPTWTPDQGEAPLHMGILYAVLMCCGSIALNVFEIQAFAIGRRISVKLRSILITEIMTKALRRSGLGGPISSRRDSDDGHSQDQDQSGDTDDSDAGEDDEDEIPTGRATDGQVNNLLSNDVMRVLSDEVGYLHFLFPESPLRIIGGLVCLVRLVGWSAFAGLAVLVVMMPAQWLISKYFLRMEEELLKIGDRRLNHTLETLLAIKTVKIFAWEKPFRQKLDAIRTMELAVLRRRLVLILCESAAFSATPTFATLAVFGVHTYVLQRPLSAEIAFTALAFLELVREGLETLPSQVPEVLSALISLRRVAAFLQEDETAKYDQLLGTSEGPDHPLVGFTGAAAFGYRPSEELEEGNEFQLHGLDISFPAGLTIVIGPVGSGKTSLLLALLGEMHRIKGRNYLPSPLGRDSLSVEDGLINTVAYAPQTPWLLGTTIKENILFGLPYEKARFDAVLFACALGPDLKILEYGEETEVGEKGTALSGGQKARIGLARCLYSYARVLLIDDALSALDASTSEHVYKHYLRGALAKGRTIVMVTHAVSLTMPGASMVVALKQGAVTAQDSPEKILEAGLYRDEIQELITVDMGQHNSLDIKELEDDQGFNEAAQLKDILDKKAAFEEAEKLAQGAVSRRAYSLWVSNFAPSLMWAGIFLLTAGTLYTAAQGTDIASTAWLKKWAKRDDGVTYERSRMDGHNQVLLHPSSLETRPSIQGKGDNSVRYLTIYVMLSMVHVLLNSVKEFVLMSGALAAAASIYRQLITAILSAKPTWFDRVPVGRIMNRVSQDISTVDQELGSDSAWLLDTLLHLLAVVGIIAWDSPILTVFSIVLLLAAYLIGSIYLQSARDLKRLESVQRSPLYTLLGDILSGAVLIRACGDTGRFTQQCMRLVDQANRPYHALWVANRWLGARVSVLSSFITLLVSLVLILSPGVDAARAGFILSYAIVLVDSIFWFVRLYSGFEVSLASVERIDEYLELPSERADGVEPPAYWPSETGGIVVNNLRVRYGPELPLVLDNVSFEIGPGEKIGVCGRTGSGKSSLTSCLFRFLEAETGQILIDGIDISTVPLATLRHRLTVIPQHPDIFQGTVRSNLDPFGEYEDLDIWNALERCCLVSREEVILASRQALDSTTSIPTSIQQSHHSRANQNGNQNGSHSGPHDTVPESSEDKEPVNISSLDMAVNQGGTKFSQGQRQLLALARGLLKLRESRILILDECTASLDTISDAKIQQTRRKEMSHATMLVVAHRLRSIADLDRVLLLDRGKVIEFAPPYELLQDERSAFYALAVRSGEFDVLLGMASKHYQPLRQKPSTQGQQ